VCGDPTADGGCVEESVQRWLRIRMWVGWSGDEVKTNDGRLNGEICQAASLLQRGSCGCGSVYYSRDLGTHFGHVDRAV
jgi:hypothetical protein